MTNLVCIAFVILCSCGYFHEKLLLKILPNEDLLVEYTFEITSRELLPWVLVDMMKNTRTSEVRIVFTSGDWLEHWGCRTEAFPQGVAISGLTKGDWNKVKESLGEMSCSSPNYQGYNVRWPLDEITFQPTFQVDYFTVFPRKVFCSENLKLWMNLLPCRSRSGMASFIRPSIVFQTKFQALSARVNDHTFELTISLVRHWKKHWISLVGVIGDLSLTEDCPSVDKSSYTLDTPAGVVSELNPWETGAVNISYLQKPVNNNCKAVADRLITGTTGAVDISKVIITLKNLQPDPLNVLLLDIHPWFVKVWYHTIKLYINENEISVTSPSISNFNFELALEHEDPGRLELGIWLNTASVFRVEYEYDRRFLPAYDFPPDASRGLDWPSPIFTVTRGNITFRLIPGHIPILLPLPDRSMVFNVIMTTSLVYALAFGLVFKTMYREYPISENML